MFRFLLIEPTGTVALIVPTARYTTRNQLTKGKIDFVSQFRVVQSIKGNPGLGGMSSRSHQVPIWEAEIVNARTLFNVSNLVFYSVCV